MLAGEASDREPTQPTSQQDVSLFMPTQVLNAVDSESWRRAIIHELSEEHYVGQITEILLSRSPTAHYTVTVDVDELLNSNSCLTHLVFKKPRAMIRIFEDAVRYLMADILTTDPRRSDMTPKEHVHVRFPKTISSTIRDTSLPSLPRSANVNRLLFVSGIVTRTYSPKIVTFYKEFKCTECHSVFREEKCWETGRVEKPVKCGALRVNGRRCNGRVFNEVTDGADKMSNCHDYQEIVLQEHTSSLSLGTIPRSITVILENDLVDSCHPGNEVTITAIVIKRYKSLNLDQRCESEICLYANCVEIRNSRISGTTQVSEEMKNEFRDFWETWRESPFEGRNHILSSVCPSLYGLYMVKLAVTLVLIGGVTKSTAEGLRTRGEAHLLLVGDPGCGKSQFLRFAASVIPRSVLTTGMSSVNAGLTCTVVKVGGESALEAGALVLADRGLCCIDEFGSIRRADKTALHEAMEQQTLSVAKAKLHTRCSILAATNFNSITSPEQPPSVNLELASPLLSRFDLVIVLLDRRNAAWDKVLSEFILGTECQSPQTEEGGTNRDSVMGDDVLEEDSIWDIKKLQAYILYVKETFEPVLSKEAETLLTKYYTIQRQTDNRNQARTTIRLLESLIRLSQAHARLMHRNTVKLQDAIVAVTLMEATNRGLAMANSYSTLHMGFPKNGDEEYSKWEMGILHALGLQHLATTTREL